MQFEPLEVADAWVCTPHRYRDDRGVFLEWFRGDLLANAVGRRVDIVQANHSVSRCGTVRGLHFADVPPGQAKVVTCARGAVLDVVVDVRAGSPTFGKHSAVRLDDADRRAVFLAEGLAHAFCALTDDAAVTYLITSPYDPPAEHAVHPLDPVLALPWPDDIGDLLLSPKDAQAPTLATAEAEGVLPAYDVCVARYRALGR